MFQLRFTPEKLSITARPSDACSRVGAAVALMLSAALVTGCHGFPACSKTDYTPPENVYIRVDYETEVGEFERVKGEVYASDIYKADYATYKTVAVRVPESCLDETAAQKEGQTSGKVILNTTCGAYFSELEKSLVKNGYRVISWDRIKNSYDAAVELGADIVFMVNSLETSFAKLGAEAKTVYKFYDAKADGTVTAPVALTPENREVFKGFVEQRLHSVGGGVEGKQVGFLQLLQPAVERLAIQDGFVVRRNLASSQSFVAASVACVVELFQPRAELAVDEDTAQGLDIARLHHQVGR